jgi:hypothetical protein
VRVTAKWKHFEGDAYLGQCSYRSKEEFCQPGSYWDDMKEEALEDLNQQVAAVAADIQELQT